MDEAERRCFRCDRVMNGEACRYCMRAVAAAVAAKELRLFWDTPDGNRHMERMHEWVRAQVFPS